MEKKDFCIKLINDLDSLINFIKENNNLFYEVDVPEGYPYFPPRDAQSLLMGNVCISLMSAKLHVEDLHEYLLFPDRRII